MDTRSRLRHSLRAFYPSDSDCQRANCISVGPHCALRGPGCGARVPLIKGLWLSKKSGRTVAYRLDVRERNVTVSIQLGVTAREVGARNSEAGLFDVPRLSAHDAGRKVRLQAAGQRGLPETLLARGDYYSRRARSQLPGGNRLERSMLLLRGPSRTRLGGRVSKIGNPHWFRTSTFRLTIAELSRVVYGSRLRESFSPRAKPLHSPPLPLVRTVETA